MRACCNFIGMYFVFISFALKIKQGPWNFGGIDRFIVNSEKREPSPVEGLGNNGVQMVQYATSERGTLRSLSAKPSSPSDSLLRSPRYLFNFNSHLFCSLDILTDSFM